MDININKSNQGDFNGVEIVKNEEKTKPTSIDYMIMNSTFENVNQEMKVTINFSKKFKEIGFDMLENNMDRHEELLKELRNNIKLSYSKDGENRSWFLDIRPTGDNIGYLE